MSEEKKIETYSEFWPYYLAEHSSPMTRFLHLIGTIMAVGTLVWALVTKNWAYLFAVPVAGYSFAWASHFFIEKNKPATFKYPLWSFISDFRMAAAMLMFKKLD